MKTFATSAVAAAVALVGSMAMAQGTYHGDFGTCPDGFCGTKPGCTNGSCGVAGCPGGQCGPAACPDGSCGVGTGYGRYGAAARHVQPLRPRSAGLGYGAPVTQPYYAAKPAACPGGKCPPMSAVSHTAGYRPVATIPNCVNGRCGTVPVPRHPNYQPPRFNFLGLNW